MVAGRSSKIVALARSLHQRKAREESGKLLAEGPQAVEYGLRAGQIEALLVTEDGLTIFGALVREADRQGVPVSIVDERTSKAVAGTNSPQGVTAIAALPRVLPSPFSAGPSFVVLLEQAQDPGNVGTIIRTADAAGADLVILGPGSADPFSPKCVRASAGSVFGIDIVATSDPIAEIAAAKRAGLSILSTSADAAVSVFDTDSQPGFAPPVMWVFGNEARGLDEATQAACDVGVQIPIAGGAESLNIATASAVCLFTSARLAGS